jgi:hypothetical protein
MAKTVRLCHKAPKIGANVTGQGQSAEAGARMQEAEAEKSG